MDANEVNGLPSKASSSLTLNRAEAVTPRSLSQSMASGRIHEVPTSANPLWNVLHALRLRWAWMLLLGLPLGTALAYVAWMTTPTPYTAHAELFCQPRRFFWDTKEDDPKFEVYKQTTMRLIKDPMVITAALSDPRIGKLKYVRESPDILEQLMKELRVSSPAQEFIRIELSGPESAELAEVVNAVMSAFVKEVVDKEKEQRAERLTKLQKVLALESENLKVKQKELRDIDKKLEVGSATQVDLKRQAQLDMQLQIRKEMSQLHPQIIELDLLLASTGIKPNEQSRGAPSGSAPSDEMLEWRMKDSEFARLFRQRASAQRLLDEWRRRVREPHREIDRLTSVIKEAGQLLADRQAEIEPSIRNIIARNQMAATNGATPTTGTREQLQERLEMLKALLTRYESELETLQAAEKTLATEFVDREAFAEDVAALKETTDIYSKEVQKRTVEQDLAPPAIRVHREARTPTIADAKKRTLFTAAGAFGGLGLVAALFILLEIVAQRISNISQVRVKTALPVLGALPLIPLNLNRLRSTKQRLASIYWRDALREAFDGVQSMLRHNPRCDDCRVVMVASSAEAEGKTTSTSQLASSFARAGYRVLLVDGDFRRPSLPKELGLKNQHGLCEVLEGEMTLENAIVSTDLAELDLLPAGHLTDKTRGLLSRDETGRIFRDLTTQYSYIFIDSAPVLLSADTMSLAKHVDGVLMIVRKDLTRLRRLESALSRFDMIGVPVLGLLSIGLGDSSTSYGYGYGYGYRGVQPRRSDNTSNPDLTSSPRLADSMSTVSA